MKIIILIQLYYLLSMLYLAYYLQTISKVLFEITKEKVMESIIILIVEDKDEEAVTAETAIKKHFGIPTEDSGSYLGLANLREQLNLPSWRGYKNNDNVITVMRARNLTEAKNGFDQMDRFITVFPKAGILTDLMFPGTTGIMQANGVEVLLTAIEKKLPVVMCSDTNHHDVGFVPLLAKMLGPAHPSGKIPVILDRKDWDKAVSELMSVFV